MTISGRPQVDGGRGDADQPDQDISTYLVVPYFNGDEGRPLIERPLGPSIVSWLCPAIIVNGQPGKNVFERGEPTTVTVDVANWGSGTLSAPVYVRVWWSDPSTGFTTLNLFGQETLAIPTGGIVRRSNPIIGTIPISAPAHVCLLVNVWSPLEAPLPSSAINPTNDRHWAQLNINDLTVQPGEAFHFIFWVGNPLPRAATYEVSAGALAREALVMFERVRRTETVRLERPSVQLREIRQLGNAPGREETIRSQSKITLKPGERRPFALTGRLPADMEPGTSTVLEILTLGIGGDERELLGSIGLFLTASQAR